MRTFTRSPLNAAELAATKSGRTVTLCFPCRNEAATIGKLVAAARRDLVDDSGLVDELLVIDDRSTDETAVVARDAGAAVVDIRDIHAEHGDGEGKGNVLWASLIASSGDVIVWCDGDVTSFEPHWVVDLAAPLLGDDSVALVKADYHRPTDAGGGGRTTELVARPLLSLLAPALASLGQPLSGEMAGRRSALERLSFPEGWGVEIAMLLDLDSLFGASSIGQVDLGVRIHRHRDLHDLAPQAAEVLATVLSRRGGTVDLDRPEQLIRPDGSLRPLNLAERPPIRP